jgi:integrase
LPVPLTRWEIGREFGKSADLGRTAAEFARHSRAPATESAYASDWADFSAWCNSAERIALPAEPVTIGAYLSDRSGILKVSTLNRRLAAITAMHRLGGHGLDGKHPAIALVLAGIRRTYGTRQVAKRALLTEDLRRIVRKLRTDTPEGCRDRALLLVCFGAAMRRSELIALDLDDITITQAGLTILVHRSKTDQEGQGREIGIPRSRKSATCPVGGLEAWLELTKSPIDSTYQDDREQNENSCVDGKSPNETSGAAKVSPGFRMPLFTRVDHGRITADRLTGRAVAEIVKRAAKRVGIDPSKVAGHSLRSGFATSAARGGASLSDIMAQTGHKNSDVAMRYVQRGKILQNPASKAVRL